MSNNGPLGLLPGSPWFMEHRPKSYGFQQPAPDFEVVTTVNVQSRFTANPGVLVSGRRCEKPGLNQ